MGWIKIGGSDVLNSNSKPNQPKWVLVEGRVVDGGFSRWAAWMTEAAGSLTLRIVERHAILGKDNPLGKIQLVNPVGVLHQASKDLTFKQTYQNRLGKLMNVSDYNEQLAEYGDYLRNRIPLPAAEHRAVDELFDISDRLRRADLPNGYIKPLMYRMDAAARLGYLLKFFSLPDIHSHNQDAVDRSFLWSRRQPAGPGFKYWQIVYETRKAPDPLGQDLITYYKTNPCPTVRSAIRGAAVADLDLHDKIKSIQWQKIFGYGESVLLDPYDNDPSVLEKIRQS